MNIGMLIGAIAGVCAVMVYRMSCAASDERKKQKEQQEQRKAPVTIKYEVGKNEADNSKQ